MGRLVTLTFPGVVLLLAHGDIPLATGYLAPIPTAARTRTLPPWVAPLSSPYVEPRTGRSSYGSVAAAATTPPSRTFNCSAKTRRSSRPRGTTAAAGAAPLRCCAPAAADDALPSPDSRLHDTGGGVAAPSAVVSAAGEPKEEEKHGEAGWDSAGLIQVAEALGEAAGRVGAPSIAGVDVSAAAAAAAAATAGKGVVRKFEREDGAPWTEFEDWLLQDTFSRYVIGSGKHVLWRRMVREVPELMGRTPQEARTRWLRLTGRLESGGGGGERLPGSPSLNSFYAQPPVLEHWEEIVEGEGMGSFRGNVFGQLGLADGTVMTTAPVDASGRKLQDQYVATQCGVVYELGEERETDLVGQASSKMLKIAPATVLALSAALYAFTALSHHVQVEVFVI